MATTPAERKFLFLDDSSASIKQRNDESDFANDDLFFKWLAGEPNAETNEKYVEARIKSNVFGFNDLLSTYAIHALCEKRNSDCSEGILLFVRSEVKLCKITYLNNSIFFLLRYLLPRNTKREFRHHKEIFRCAACEGRRNRIYV